MDCKIERVMFGDGRSRFSCLVFFVACLLRLISVPWVVFVM